MKKENFKLKSKCDGLILDVDLFIPDGEIQGIVQLSHGMVEHKKFYYDFMEYLTNQGYVTIMNDHRGHGNSVKEKSDLGYMYEESSDYLIEDLHQVTEYVKERFPKKQIILFGHSMGSLIVRKYIKKYDNEIDKLIVCGSPSINKFAKFGLFASKMVKTFKGERYRSELLNTLGLTSDKSGSWLSYNIDFVEKFNNDEEAGYVFTANGFINLTHLMIDVYSKKGWELKNKDLKIFFIAGEDDIVIKSKDKWLKSIKFLEDRGYKNIEYKSYPHMKHVILCENNNEIVYKDIIEFIKK